MVVMGWQDYGSRARMMLTVYNDNFYLRVGQVSVDIHLYLRVGQNSVDIHLYLRVGQVSVDFHHHLRVGQVSVDKVGTLMGKDVFNYDLKLHF